jgi:hypothetical protein
VILLKRGAAPPEKLDVRLACGFREPTAARLDKPLRQQLEAPAKGVDLGVRLHSRSGIFPVPPLSPEPVS